MAQATRDTARAKTGMQATRTPRGTQTMTPAQLRLQAAIDAAIAAERALNAASQLELAGDLPAGKFAAAERRYSVALKRVLSLAKQLPFEPSRTNLELRARVALLLCDLSNDGTALADLRPDACAADRVKAQLVLDVLRYTGVAAVN